MSRRRPSQIRVRFHGAPKTDSLSYKITTASTLNRTSKDCRPKFGGPTGPHGVPSTAAEPEYGHSLTEDEDSSLSKNTARPRRRQQRRLSGHPPTSAAVGLLALINHTVRTGRERKVRPACTGRRHDRRADAGRKSPLLGADKGLRFLPPFAFLGFRLRRWHRPSSAPTMFEERETEEPGAGSLGVCHRLSSAAEVAQIELRDR